ncbi:dienelactone hydrolase family protein [Streptomyces sp. NPDC001205]
MSDVPAVSATPVEYRHGSSVFEGLLLRGEGPPGPAPTVLVFPGMEGRTGGMVDLAKEVVPWGYQAFAVDLYGKGVSGSTPAELRSLMQPLMDDRALLAERLAAVVAAVAALPEVDASRIAAAGFCFGGLCVLDLARAGAPVTGVASFHGVLTPPPAPSGRRIDCKVAVFHGWDDPFARPDDVTALADELTSAGADWQLLAFGGTAHGFMAPTANLPALGVMYDAVAARRSWAAAKAFLAECLPEA